jgi:hypothetical protein
MYKSIITTILILFSSFLSRRFQMPSSNNVFVHYIENHRQLLLWPTIPKKIDKLRNMYSYTCRSTPRPSLPENPNTVSIDRPDSTW